MDVTDNIKTLDCTFDFIWLTPLACSMCRYENTTKSYGKCDSGMRKVILDEGEKCILAEYDNTTLLAEMIYSDTSIQAEPYNISDIKASGAEFAFMKEFDEDCNEVQVSYVMLIIAGTIFVMLLAAVLVAIMVSRGYKKKYNKYMEEKGEKRNLNTPAKNEVPAGKQEDENAPNSPQDDSL